MKQEKLDHLNPQVQCSWDKKIWVTFNKWVYQQIRLFHQLVFFQKLR